MRPVGYLLNTREGLAGEPGLYYDYILAGNGVFIQARSPLLQATVQIADVEVRGLQPMAAGVELINGKIPYYLYNLALSALFIDRCRERYLAVTWENGYRLRDTSFEAGECTVKYSNLPSTIMDIHSHGTMVASFSYTDDRDEQGLRLSMVVGRLDTLILEIEIRVGVYGYFGPVKFEEVFT